MKKLAIAAIASLTTLGAWAQSSISAYQLSQNDLRGTARFMSMGGAFGALGGDLSTLTQNPAGIGLYRSSEIGITLDIDAESTDCYGEKNDKTHVYCNNFGYIGAVSIDSDVMPYFQWGVSYSRQASFDRTVSGWFDDLGTSMSNYIANFSNGYSPEILDDSMYNPYWDSNADWLSILAYNSYIINPKGGTSDYSGLFQDDVTTGNAQFRTRTRGYIDEYTVNFGGNIMNTVYWGLGFGVTDLDFKEEAFYDEELQGALIARNASRRSYDNNGDAYYALDNFKHVNGSGVNFKAGLIFKPINEFRLGFAVHTPTYYKLSESYDAIMDYSYSSDLGEGTKYTDNAYFDWELRTPWKIMVSAAGVIGGRFIISADYEYDAYNKMRVSDAHGDEYYDVSEDIDYYFRGANIVRLGAEFRVTPQFSVRAGYNYSSDNTRDGINDGEQYIYTSGCNPAYTFDTSTRYITCGLGYRYKGFYADAAYVNKYRKSSYHPFSSFEDEISWVWNPMADFTTTNHNIVLSIGYKF